MTLGSNLPRLLLSVATFITTTFTVRKETLTVVSRVELWFVMLTVILWSNSSVVILEAWHWHSKALFCGSFFSAKFMDNSSLLHMVTGLLVMPSVLWHCWLGINPTSTRPVKIECGYLSGARWGLFAYGPADATASQNPIISCLI